MQILKAIISGIVVGLLMASGAPAETLQKITLARCVAKPVAKFCH